MSSLIASDLNKLLLEIDSCVICKDSIPQPRPVLRANSESRLLIIGQAPGTKVHQSGIPWHDASGNRLRSWMGVDVEDFYDVSKIAIVPMGFCYPGKGKSGDLPPRPECAPQWHQQVLEKLPNVRCTLLIGQYAQNYYLEDDFKTLTERVQHWQRYAPTYYVLPHPSPRNQMWLKRNPWFEESVVPQLRGTIASLLS